MSDATIPGVHHVTAVAGDAQRNVDFYTGTLGIRLVKTTVNFDAPDTYHLYYGDETGAPGTILTFFPFAGVRRGAGGSGSIAAVAWRVPDASLPYWSRRLAEAGAEPGPLTDRFGQRTLVFHDPDGLALELVGTDHPGEGQVPWYASPVPAEHQVRGFHSITLWVTRAEDSDRVLTDALGFTRTGEAGEGGGRRVRYTAADDRSQTAAHASGRIVDIVENNGFPRARMGAGTIHHAAFRARSDEEQAAWRSRLADYGLRVTPVRDRQYFRSIYFQEPGGALLEIATDEPGFLRDEPLSSLGTELTLPPWLEPERARIAERLPTLLRTDQEVPNER